MITFILVILLYKPVMLIIGALLLKYGVKKYLNRDIQYIKWFIWMYGIIKEGFINIIKLCKKNEYNQ